MSDNNQDTLEFDDEDDFSDDDYGFIIGPDGELKSVMYPENLMEEPPEKVQLILKLLGIENIETVDTRVLH